MARKKTSKRLLSMLLIVLSLLGVFQTNTYAHDVAVVQVFVDTDNWTYRGSVVREKDPGDEGKHFEKKYLSTADDMLFSFPGVEDKDGHLWWTKKNNATGIDIDRAFFVKDSLVPSLNEAIRIKLQEQDGAELSDLDQLTNLAKIAAASCSDGTNGPAGMAEIGGILLPCRVEKYEGSGVYIGWLEIIEQAEHLARDSQLTVANMTEVVQPSTLEKHLADMLKNVTDGIKNLLDLFSLEDLVFSRGLRSSKIYEYGIIPNASMQTVNFFFMLNMAVALSLLSVAVIRLIIKRNAAMITATPFDLVYFADGIKRIFLVGFLCIGSYFFIRMCMQINTALVDVFGATMTRKDVFGTSQMYSNLLAGILIIIAELFVTIYLNVFYILRGFTVAILVAGAPFFIVALAFGNTGRGIFSAWLKELLANIFVQSFQAFSFAFLGTIMTSTRGIESLVLMYALLPLTSFFKSLVLGSSGGLSEQLAGGFTSKATGLASSAIKSGAGAIGGAGSAGAEWAAGKIEKGGKDKEEKGEDSGDTAEGNAKIQENKAKLKENENKDGGTTKRQKIANAIRGGSKLTGAGARALGGTANTLAGLGGSVALGGMGHGNSFNAMARDGMNTLDRNISDPARDYIKKEERGREREEIESAREEKADARNEQRKIEQEEQTRERTEQRQREREESQRERQQEKEQQQQAEAQAEAEAYNTTGRIGKERTVRGGTSTTYDREIATKGTVTRVENSKYQKPTGETYKNKQGKTVQSTVQEDCTWMSYDKDNFSDQQQQYLDNIRDADNDTLYNAGVIGFREEGNTAYIGYDQQGILNMGADKISANPSNANITIDKNHKQPQQTSFIFDVNNVPRRPQTMNRGANRLPMPSSLDEQFES